MNILKPVSFNDVNTIANIKKYHLIINKNIISYQYFHYYNKVYKIPRSSTLWLIDKTYKWKAKIGKKIYYENDNRINFFLNLEKTYPECAEWLLFNIEWLK